MKWKRFDDPCRGSERDDSEQSASSDESRAAQRAAHRLLAPRSLVRVTSVWLGVVVITDFPLDSRPSLAEDRHSDYMGNFCKIEVSRRIRRKLCVKQRNCLTRRFVETYSMDLPTSVS